jgi:AraC-like DNA-binding protein
MPTVDSVRAEAWGEQLESCFAGLHPERYNGHLPRGSLNVMSLDDVGMYDVRGSTQMVRRTSGAVRREPLDLLKVCLLERGDGCVVDQERRHVSLESGQFALYDLNRPYALTIRGSWRCMVMTFPRSALGLPETSLATLMERSFDTATGVGSVFASCLRTTLVQRETLVDTAPGRLGEAAVALLAASLGSGSSLAEDQAKIVLRERVLEYVRTHLGDVGLSPGSVSAALHMSPRSLHRLFKDAGDTFGGHVRRLRLEAVRRDLADPLLARRSIAVLAARRGITDQPWLSRAFRAEYGVSPSSQRPRATGHS